MKGIFDGPPSTKGEYMKRIYYESFNEEDIEYVYKTEKPDVYRIHMRRDLKTLKPIYCIDMYFVESAHE